MNGKNVLPIGVNSLLLKKDHFQKGSRNFSIV